MNIYIYIYCHPQTDCFIVSQLFSVARHVGCLKPGSKPVQLYVRLSIRPLSQQVYHVGEGIISYYVATAAAAFICLHFYTLLAIYIYIYIYIFICMFSNKEHTRKNVSIFKKFFCLQTKECKS